MSSSPERSPRIDADDRTDDPPPEKAAMEDANDEEPVAEAANGRSKGDRSPSPRERSLSPARADSLDKSPARRAEDRSASPARVRSDSRDRRRPRSDSRDYDRRRRRSDSREDDRSRHRDRSRSRSRSRDRRYRDRSRSRDRYRRRSRSRSRDRYRSSRNERDDRRRSPVVAPYYARPRRTPPRTGTTLFVAGLNFITTEREVETKFGKYGTCKEARIVRNPVNGESRGFGFVAMKYEEDCDDAIKHLDGAEWNGRRLAVERARNVK